MPRDYKVYVDDILEAIGKIKRFTSGIDRTAFLRMKRHSTR